MNKKGMMIAVTLLLVLVAALFYMLVNANRAGVVHDVAVTRVTASETRLYVGETLDVLVTVENKGNVNENFNVTSYYNATEIGTQEVSNLAPNTGTTLTFSWNTSYASPSNFILKAGTTVRPSETNTSNNSLSDGVILLREQPLQTAVLYVNPEISVAQVGQELTVDIDVSNVTDLYGWELRLSYNNTILNLTDVAEGTFLRSAGATYFAYKTSDTADSIKADCTLIGDVPGPEGNGTLATVKFHVQNSGVCPLNLTDAILLSSLSEDMNYTLTNGVFRINP
jgi:hypothetical protein